MCHTFLNLKMNKNHRKDRAIKRHRQKESKIKLHRKLHNSSIDELYIRELQEILHNITLS